MPERSRLQIVNELLGLIIAAYIFYAMVDKDKRMWRLIRSHAVYQWSKFGRWYRKATEPAWKGELRDFVEISPNSVKDRTL